MSASLPLPLYYREVPSLCEYLLQDQPAYFQHSRPDSCEALDAAIIPQMILNSRSEPLPLGATLSLWSNSDPIEFRLQFFCGSGIKAALEDGKIIYEPADFHWCLLSATFAPVCSELPCGTDISLNSDDFEFGVSKLEAEYSGFRSYVFVRHIQAGTLSIRPEGWLIAKLLAIVALNITATCPFRWR